MAEYTINIEDDELEELQEIVEEINKAHPGTNMTEQLYVQQLVSGRMAERVKETYVGFVKQKSVAELKPLLGKRKDVKNGVS